MPYIYGNQFPAKAKYMKLLDTAAIRKADEVTLQKQSITSFQLMERAAREAFLWLKRQFPDKETVYHVFCGEGNNGGDELIIARHLKDDGYTTYLNQVTTSGRRSPDNEEALKLAGEDMAPSDEISSFGKGKAVVIDAIFGIGLTREVSEGVKAVINMINSSGAAVISIDMPSGMFMDRPTDVAVVSNYVLTFQFSKMAFYMPGNYRFIENVEVLSIGIDQAYIDAAPSGYYLTSLTDANALCNKVSRYAHKGTQGHVLVIGGSYGKVGAAILCAKAALHSGCGLVTAYIPGCGYTAMQSAFPEAMVLTSGDHNINEISFEISPSVIAVGPGLGQSPEVQAALWDFLQLHQLPMVVDADALNILSYHKEMLELLPAKSVITPHPKELQRLIGESTDDFEHLEKVKTFSKEHDLVVVAKNARTMIIYHDKVYINPTGNAALATGGSGDVLTGIISGLMAQGYDAVIAAVFGAFLHGRAAETGSKETGIQAFTASDIIRYMGKAYLNIEAAC